MVVPQNVEKPIAITDKVMPFRFDKEAFKRKVGSVDLTSIERKLEVRLQVSVFSHIKVNDLVVELLLHSLKDLVYIEGGNEIDKLFDCSNANSVDVYNVGV